MQRFEVLPTELAASSKQKANEKILSERLVGKDSSWHVDLGAPNQMASDLCQERPVPCLAIRLEPESGVGVSVATQETV